MNTPDSTTAPARLQNVQQLLEKLGSMKAEGLGARERLDFLQNRGCEIVEEFSFEDAFDADARASSTRLTELEDLLSCARTFETAWRGAPLSSDVRQAGSSLFKHVTNLIQDAQKSERTSEIDMLGQLWMWAPDLSCLYPDLTGAPPIERPENVQLEASPLFDLPGNQQLKQLNEVKDRLEAEVTQQNLEDTEFGDATCQVKKPERSPPEVDEDATAGLKADLERKTRELDRGTHFRRGFSVKEAPEVSRVAPSPRLETKDALERHLTRAHDFGLAAQKSLGLLADLGHSRTHEARRRPAAETAARPRASHEAGVDVELLEHASEEGTRLRQEAWTDAIREVTLAPWHFHLEASSHVGGRGAGTSMVWRLKGDEEAYVKLEMSRGRELEHHVRLEWTSPKLRIRNLEREFTESEFTDLHLDPVAFVAKLLDDE